MFNTQLMRAYIPSPYLTPLVFPPHYKRLTFNIFQSQIFNINQDRKMDHENIQNQDLNLVLSSDAKPRLKWTPELHQRFIDAVTQLGGPESESLLNIFVGFFKKFESLFIYGMNN